MKKVIILIVVFSFPTLAINTFAQENNYFDDISKFLRNFYSIDAKNDLNKSSNGINYLSVHFLNGDCSHCIGKISRTEQFYDSITNDEVLSIFIVETSDTMYFNFFKDRFNIHSPVLWDKDYFINRTIENLTNTEYFLFNNKGEMLIRGDFINDEKMKNKYLKLFSDKSIK